MSYRRDLFSFRCTLSSESASFFIGWAFGPLYLVFYAWVQGPTLATFSIWLGLGGPAKYKIRMEMRTHSSLENNYWGDPKPPLPGGTAPLDPPFTGGKPPGPPGVKPLCWVYSFPFFFWKKKQNSKHCLAAKRM